ncbi:NHLP bacteriocin system secretion protein [uncultured Aureimonas sp.]|uniref:NHLP bacteriocin system secretion protein n=1 Tax=uncultured Aureimonas sp. TaxID=1604662 RepID=UPI0025DE1E64|nr:NHLP bacteriocin system secretion protein [uncultured Aureimonas sp.]
MNNAKQALAAARKQAIEAKGQMAATEDEAVAARNAGEAETRHSLDARSRQRGVVVAPIDGRVTEWKAAAGARVAPGQPVLSIEGGVTGTELLLYLPSDGGKQVRPGMKVWVAPSTVKREEYGTLIGTVTEVSEFPVTPQAMMSVLQNERLVQQFAPRGAPLAARVSLDADPSTPSGFRWSSGQGPALALTSCTVASGDVTVSERPPITYVIPWLRKATGLAG